MTSKDRENFVSSVNQFFSQMQKLYGKFNTLRDVHKSIDKTHEEYAYLLSKMGWYISFQMSYAEVVDIFVNIKEHRPELAEQIILLHFKKSFPYILKNLVKKYPLRQQVLNEAFKCHELGMYYSSTILFLSQADGICEGNLFIKKERSKSYFKAKKNSDFVTAVIGNSSAIDDDTRKMDKSNYFSNLNRHGVMHGLHVDYGSEKNSLKALSLLCFIDEFSM